MSTRPASSHDANPRQAKRQRRDSFSSSVNEELAKSLSSLEPLPVHTLLVSLPGILIHPPTHRYHARSLCLSLLALRKCLGLPGLTPDIECRAWTALAEVGMIVISGGFSQNEDHPWAKYIEHEVEKAASRALTLAKVHPTLCLYRPHITCITAQLSLWQQNTKPARNMLRQLLKTMSPKDPPHSIYSAHLTLISHLCTNTQTTTIKDTHAALKQLQIFIDLADKNQHRHVKLLGLVAHLRLLVSSGLWDRVEDALIFAEHAVGFEFPSAREKETEKPVLVSISNAPQSQFSGTSSPRPQKATTALPSFPDKISEVMAVHVLIIGVVFHTYIGNASCTAPRLTQLHMLMDAGSWKESSGGVIEIPFPSSHSLYIQTTHPRILLILAYLVSAVAKKDPVGRKPRRKIFGLEGLTVWEKEMRKPLVMSPWASFSDLEQVEFTMTRLKGDLLCELVSVHIMRSEFLAAEKHIEVLVAHVRSTGLWEAFSARVMLYEAHLAHAKGDRVRAADCYQVAAVLAVEGESSDDYVDICARAGIVALKIGSGDVDIEEGLKVARDCKGMGGTLGSVGKIIESCLTPEILKAKTSLKTAITFTTDSTDNHLRALVLALTSSHFMHTATDYALKMLGTCEQLAAGLGAGALKDAKYTSGADTVGNVPLRLWVAERLFELHKRQGDTARANKQELHIEALKKVMPTSES